MCRKIIPGVLLLLTRQLLCSFSDVVFPPPVKLEEPEGIRGHLKEFGYQNEAKGPVKEYDHFLSAQDFWEKHGRERDPLVYRQTVSKSPAIKLWTDEYLLEKYGDLDILVEHKRENRSSSSGRMRLREFLARYKNEDMYVVSMLPEEMMPEIQAVNTVLCGTWRNFTHESNFWMSNGGTRSVVHYDADHNFHCILEGRKDFIMIKNNKKHRKILGIHRFKLEAGSGFSLINPDAINVTSTPDIYDVEWEYATLYPGDCIYIPRAHLHQVRSYVRTIAVTTLFTEDTKMKFSGQDCRNDLLREYHNMSEIHFHWTYKKGDKMIDMGFQNAELFRRQLLEVIQSVNGKMTLNRFHTYVKSEEHGAEVYNKKRTTNLFNSLLVSTGKDYIDMEMVRGFTIPQLKSIIRIIEAPHGVVTDGKEEVLVKPGDEIRQEMETAGKEGNVKMDDFGIDTLIKNILGNALGSSKNKITLKAFKRVMYGLGDHRSERIEEGLVDLFQNVLGGAKKGFLDKSDVDSLNDEQKFQFLDVIEDIKGFQGQGSDESQGLKTKEENEASDGGRNKEMDVDRDPSEGNEDNEDPEDNTSRDENEDTDEENDDQPEQNDEEDDEDNDEEGDGDEDDNREEENREESAGQKTPKTNKQPSPKKTAKSTRDEL